MSGDINMAQVVESMSGSLTDDGIAIWLGTEHSVGRFAGRRPIDVCRTAEGRYEVWAYGEAMNDGVFM